MTTKEKKESAIIAVMLLATILVIYFNFLKPKSAPAPATLTQIPGGPVLIPANGTAPAAGAIPGAAGGASVSAGASGLSSASSFLPAGTSLNLNVLDDKHFKALVPPVYPVVTPDEIGSDNPFGQ